MQTALESYIDVRLTIRVSRLMLQRIGKFSQESNFVSICMEVDSMVRLQGHGYWERDRFHRASPFRNDGVGEEGKSARVLT